MSGPGIGSCSQKGTASFAIHGVSPPCPFLLTYSLIVSVPCQQEELTDVTWGVGTKDWDAGPDPTGLGVRSGSA
jgi:hypothetical protein